MPEEQIASMPSVSVVHQCCGYADKNGVQSPLVDFGANSGLFHDDEHMTLGMNKNSGFKYATPLPRIMIERRFFNQSLLARQKHSQRNEQL